MNIRFSRTITFLLVFLFFTSCTTLDTSLEKPEEKPAPDESAKEEVDEEVESDYTVYENITITQGEHPDKIVISWEPASDDASYLLLRAKKESEPYSEVERIEGTGRYEDTSVEPGMKVYYRLISLDKQPEQNPEDQNTEDEENASEIADAGEPAEDDSAPASEKFAEAFHPEKKDPNRSNYGYASVKRPASKNLDRLMQKYTKGKTGPQTELEKKHYKKHMEYLKEKYEHPVKLNMILTITRPYINSGTLEIHNGFSSYVHKRSLRTVYIFNEDHTAVYIFNNNVTSGNLQHTKMRPLYKRLIENSVGFCGYAGEKQVKDENGYTRIIPGFNVVALAAQYNPRYRDWKNETFLIVTSNKKLRREIQKARSN